MDTRKDLATIGFSHDWALYLDVDGTLLDFAEQPDDVEVSDELRRLIDALRTKLDGAVALITGRSLENLDDLFGIPNFPAAGLHGVEIRPGNGSMGIEVQTVDKATLDLFRRRIASFVRSHPDLFVEDKGLGIAVHYRKAPELRKDVERILGDALSEQHDEFQLQKGKMLAEIKSRRADKGFAIRKLMGYKPFSGRTPVFLGDDLTDEDGFAAVNDMQGISIKVGNGDTAARYHLSTPGDVLTWLNQLDRYLSNDKQ